jgi:hypothetical protein
MSTRPSAFEQFMTLFRELKRIAGTPQRLVTFYDESSELQSAIQNLESFLLRTDFERRAFAGRKLFRQVPDGFERDWNEYDADGRAYAIAHLGLRHIFQDLTYKPDEHPKSKTSSIDTPDPESDEEFNPIYHAGAAALQLGLDWLRVEIDLRPEYGNEDDQRVANMCRLACGAYDYLTKTIGVDPSEIFRRWQTVPPFFMPAAVSNRHGDERGSLDDLLTDAIRAYVCGAPAAAIRVCSGSIHKTINSYSTIF